MNRKEIIDALVEDWRGRPLAYGVTDCFQWVATAVHALTGVDYRERFPKYASRDEADAIIGEAGGVAVLLIGCLGDPIPQGRATKGDIVVADFGDGLTPAVCLGLNCCTPSPRGLSFIPTARAVAAWAV